MFFVDLIYLNVLTGYGRNMLMHDNTIYPHSQSYDVYIIIYFEY